MSRAIIALAVLLTWAAPTQAADLTTLTTVPGRAFDATPERVLYRAGGDDAPGPKALVIRDVATGQDTTLPAGTGRVANPFRARLIDGGAVYATYDPADPSVQQLRQWRNGLVADLGPITGALDVAGDHVIWISGTTLTRRTVSTGIAVAVSAAARGGDADSRVTPDGDVVFTDTLPRVHRWRNGITTPMGEPGSERPVTDGALVAFEARNAEYHRVLGFNAGAGEVLVDKTSPPGAGESWYAVAGGWLAYTRRPDETSHLNGREVWVRTPQGQSAQLSPEPAMPGTTLHAVAPDGQVAYSSSLRALGENPFPLGWADRHLWFGGRWHLVRFDTNDRSQSTLLRLELDTALTATPASLTTQRSAAFTIASSAAGATFECKLDGAPWQACSGTFSASSLGDGEHTFLARSSDGVATDATPASYTWKVDGSPPEPVQLVAPAAGATLYAPEVTFDWAPTTDAASGVAGYVLEIDGVARTQQTTTELTTSLSPGPHTWLVRARDELGNTSTSVTRTFTISEDTSPPQPFSLISPPAGGVVTDVRPVFRWSAATDMETRLAGYEVTIDYMAPVVLPPSATEYVPARDLAAGQHEWSVAAIDSKGNRRATDFQRFTLDLAPPVAVIRSLETASTGETVHFDAAGSRDAETEIARHEWDLDGDGSFETDTGTHGHVTRVYTTVGRRVAALRVTDGAGRTATATTAIRIALAPGPGQPGVSINGGARFTNDPDVTLHVRWALWADSTLIANDGGFAGSVEQPLAGTYAWTLDSSGPERLPKTVYVRFPGAGGPAATYQDDIILDQTLPRILGASLRSTSRRSHSVRLRARDATSGIAAVQLGVKRGEFARTMPYQRTLRVRTKAAPRWVRAIDHAGNRSKWRRIARRR